MQDALRAAQLAVQHDQAGEYGAAATQYETAAGLLRRLAEGAPPAQRPAFEARAAEYAARVAALRELDAIASMPPPPSAKTRAPAGGGGSSDADLQARLSALKGGPPPGQAPPSDQELQERFARLAGQAPLSAPAATPAPQPAPRMSAAEAEQYERDKLAELGLPAGGGDSDVERLLAEAVASNKLAHRYGERIEGLDNDDDDPDGRAAERSELAEVLEQARDAARIEAKYGRDTPPTTGGGGGGGAGAAGDPASTAAPALGEHAHSSDDEEDDMDASVKRWLRSLGLGQYIDAVAAFANDMDEAAWITKDQVMLLPMSAAERETLLVAIARLPTPD
jgi:hypothetical protein